MSSRVGVEKNEYVCLVGHLLRQRADKPKPKKCNVDGCTSIPQRIGAEQKNKSETAAISGLPIKPKVKRKVSRASETKRKVVGKKK